MPSTIKIGYDNDLSNFYNGFAQNINLYIYGHKDINKYKTILNLPLKNKLGDFTKKIQYVNYGTRFITVAQLIEDKTNSDIYGNKLLSTRVYKK